MKSVEFVIIPEVLYWLKIGGWLLIGGCATWVIEHFWTDDARDKGWKEALQNEKRRTSNRHQK